MSQTPPTGRNPLIIFLGFLLLGAALALLLFGGSIFGGGETVSDEPTVLDQVPSFPTSDVDIAQIPQVGRSAVPAVGDPAPDFTLEDLDGNLVSLADFSGRPVIINFWATWCAPCRIEMPELQAAYDSYREEELVILALNQDEPADVARDFFYGEMDLTFTPLLDQNSAINTIYTDFAALPTTYFVSPAGLITAIHRGPLTRGQLDGYLAETIPPG